MKIPNFIQNNLRYFLAVTVLVFFFLINKSFPADIITSESCADGKCETALEVPNLSDKEPLYFANDVFTSTSKEYFRLTFQTKATRESEISIKITNPLDKEKEIKKITVNKSTSDNFNEILFSTDNNQKYSDLLFEKLNKNDGADINISGIQISKLAITDEKEFFNFKPTLKGEIDYNIPLLEQPVNTGYFNQLKDPDIILGQIFESPSDFITSIVLDLDIIKQSNNQNKKYSLDIREVNYEEGGPPEIRSIALANLEFSLTDLDKYRQEDGKYNFPLFAKVEKGKYYFFGLDNQKVEPNQFNYLRLKGNFDGEKFTKGIVAVKTKGETYSAPGDLYFKLYGIKFNEYAGKRILGGTVISDIGKGKGIFKYQPKNNLNDLADLDSYSNDIRFDAEKKAMTGIIKENSESHFIYKFETIFPFTKFRIFGKQPDINWNRATVYYSYDRENWIEILSRNIEEILSDQKKIQGLQVFDETISENTPQKSVYVKIQPKDPDLENKKWGIADFLFEAELTMR